MGSTMKSLALMSLALVAAALLPGNAADSGPKKDPAHTKKQVEHPEDPTGSTRTDLDNVTSKVTARFPHFSRAAGPIPRNNYIDDFIFGKMERDGIPHAKLSSDEEFFRRVSLDLTGRLPEPEQVRKFVTDSAPDKRAKLIDELTDAKVDPGAIPHPTHPFLDRWTYFFSDLFRNGLPELGAKGRNLFWDYINTSLLLNIPYNQLVTEMLTATARSNWESGPSNFLARNHADDSDGLAINHEDTIEDIAISSSKYFLGVNLECVSCHDGRGHLDNINLFLARTKRDQFWRHASFFGGIRIFRGFGIGQEFPVQEGPHRYDLEYPSVKRVGRYRADTAPKFLLGEQTARAGEPLRHSYARMLTSHTQFARATVNLLYSELMGIGIVDPPFEFDLDRQDPKSPPPDPWTIQPTHAELLDALARDFVDHNYSVRYIIKLIVKSSAYQLSCQFWGEWKPAYASYFARRYVRRLSAEQLYDAMSEATGVFVDLPVLGTDMKVKYAMQTRGPADLEGEVKTFLASFGQSNRDQGDKSISGSMVQASVLLNSRLVKQRIQADKGRLKELLKAEPLKSNQAIVEELFLAALGRFPTAGEQRIGITQIEQYREAGAEDLLWSLLNKTEFLFNH